MVWNVNSMYLNLIPFVFLKLIRLDGQVLFVAVNGENLDQVKKLKENVVITVKYSGVNVYNKLIQPVFFRTRNSSADMSWTDLVKQYDAIHKNKVD